MTAAQRNWNDIVIGECQRRRNTCRILRRDHSARLDSAEVSPNSENFTTYNKEAQLTQGFRATAERVPLW